MELPRRLVEELQKAYLADFGRELSYDDAKALGSGLVDVIGPVLLKPPEKVNEDECRTNRAPERLLRSAEYVLKLIRRHEYLVEDPKGTFSFEGVDVLHFHVRGRRLVAHLRVNEKQGAIYDPDLNEDLSGLLKALIQRKFYRTGKSDQASV